MERRQFVAAMGSMPAAAAWAQGGGLPMHAPRQKPGDGYGAPTLDEVFDDYVKPLDIPVFRGAQFGHIKRKFTLPIGLPVEIDAAAGTLRLLGAAVL